ncbi:MAG: hypothetical protein HOA90_20285 [Prolixibacteraceae bacterium]|nr:hypothetical protein [Prolixibacteraceae bacterium]
MRSSRIPLRALREIFLPPLIFMLNIIDANEITENAVEVFQKDKIESLIALIDSDEFTLKEKNKAIWTLVVLKDKRAHAKLKSLLTGEKCDHGKELCQSEIKKAILKIKGEFKGSWQVSR